MRFCSNLRFAELLFASAFGAKRVGTVSESTEKWDGNSAHLLTPGDACSSRSIEAPRMRTETRREQEGQRHATIEDGTTHRDEAAKKSAD
jgi:hypothetical protein